MGLNVSREAYDRNATVIVEVSTGNQAAGTATTVFVYTVPSNRTALHQIFYDEVDIAINNPGGSVMHYHGISLNSGVLYDIYAKMVLSDADGAFKQQIVSAEFTLIEGIMIRGVIGNWDNVAHGYAISTILSEFDAT